MDYMRMSWDERQALVKEFERRVDARRMLRTRETMAAALNGGQVESVELERATAEGMPDAAPAWRQGQPVWTDGEGV